MLVDSRSLWLAETNTYVIAPAVGGPAVVVDAPPDPTGIADLLAEHDLTPVALLLTHGHVDHSGGASSVGGGQVRTFVHPDDDFLTLDPLSQLQYIFGMVPPGDYSAPTNAEPLADGQILQLAGIELEVVQTPGHTPGHCCFYERREGLLFAGDQIFAGSIGRTDLPGGNHRELMSSMASKVLTLDDDVIIHPGHGPATTVGTERRTNPFLVGMA